MKYVKLLTILSLVVGLSITGVWAQGRHDLYQEKQPTTYRQAPTLKEKVQEGVLPPVKERLPDNPVVIKPFETIGEYGGTYHLATKYATFRWYYQTFLYEPLIRWSWDASKLVPGLAKSWEFSKGGRVLTIDLRKGVKWSDGEPYTVDDFLFWWRDMALNPDCPREPLGWTMVEGKPMEVVKLSDYKMELHFAGPNYLAPLAIANHYSFHYLTPKHYLKQFHPEYTDEYKDYDTLLDKQMAWKNPDLPVVYAWKTVKVKPGKKLIAQRNPYYWKVDTEGNQLPYLDKLIVHRPVNTKAMTAMAAAGKLDFHYRKLKVKNYPLLRRQAKEGNYRVLKWPSSIGAKPGIVPCLTDKDPINREILNSKKFRRALSLAINREELNNLFYLGLGRPMQATISPTSWHFTGIEGGRELYEEWANFYAEYNPEKANQLLDEAGFEWGPKHEKRLGPDGKPIELKLLVDSASTTYLEMASFLVDYWKDIGVTVHIDSRPGVVVEKKRFNDDFDLNLMKLAELDIPSFPANLVPATEPRWSAAWVKYHDTNGKKGERPPKGSFVWDLWNLLDKARKTPDPKERHKLVHEMIRIHMREGPIWIGTVGEVPTFAIVKNYFHNIPPKYGAVTGPWAVGEMGKFEPAQFFIEQD